MKFESNFTKKKHVIRDIFKKFDFWLIVDDFENHEFNVKNINNLKIKNWRLFVFTIENIYNVLNSTKQRKQKKNDEQQRQRIRSWYRKFELAKRKR